MQEEYIIRVLLAALAGGLVGLERAYHDKSAGFRTMILIATGSAFFTIMSEVVGGPISDNARIAAAVVSGVGFLGAGVIIQDGVSIKGLTTAASIWLVAALGMGMGLGLYMLVSVVTASIMVVLWLLPSVERRIDSLHEFLLLEIVIKNSDKQEAVLVELFAELGVRVVDIRRSQEDGKERILHIKAKTTPQKRAEVGRALANCKTVLRFRS